MDDEVMLTSSFYVFRGAIHIHFVSLHQTNVIDIIVGGKCAQISHLQTIGYINDFIAF